MFWGNLDNKYYEISHPVRSARLYSLACLALPLISACGQQSAEPPPQIRSEPISYQVASTSFVRQSEAKRIADTSQRSTQENAVIVYSVVTDKQSQRTDANTANRIKEDDAVSQLASAAPVSTTTIKPAEKTHTASSDASERNSRSGSISFVSQRPKPSRVAQSSVDPASNTASPASTDIARLKKTQPEKPPASETPEIKKNTTEKPVVEKPKPLPLPADFKQWESSPSKVLIVQNSKKLFIKDKKGQVKSFDVAVGRKKHRTPTGQFNVQQIRKNPNWFPTPSMKKEAKINGDYLPDRVPPGPHNPLGDYFIGFAPTYGIHGTNQPNSIGRAVSRGCIRMHNRDVRQVARLIGNGDGVTIVSSLGGLNSQTVAESSTEPTIHAAPNEIEPEMPISGSEPVMAMTDTSPTVTPETTYVSPSLPQRAAVVSSSGTSIPTVNGIYMGPSDAPQGDSGPVVAQTEPLF